jgi:hypothetical protein
MWPCSVRTQEITPCLKNPNPKTKQKTTGAFFFYSKLLQKKNVKKWIKNLFFLVLRDALTHPHDM